MFHKVLIPPQGIFSPSAREYRYIPCHQFVWGALDRPLALLLKKNYIYLLENNLLQKWPDALTPSYMLELAAFSFFKEMCPIHLIFTTEYWSWDTTAVSNLRCSHTRMHQPVEHTGTLLQSCLHTRSSACHFAVTHAQHLRPQVKHTALAKHSFPCPGRRNVQSVRQHVLDWEHQYWQRTSVYAQEKKKKKSWKHWRYTWGQVSISTSDLWEPAVALLLCTSQWLCVWDQACVVGR